MLNKNVKEALINHDRTFISEKFEPNIFAELVYNGERKIANMPPTDYKLWKVNYEDGSTKKVSMYLKHGKWQFTIL